MIVFSALAWQTRYIGVTLLVTIALMLMLQPDVELRRRLKHASWYSLAVIASMAPWAIHVLSSVGTGGRRYAVDYSISDLADNIALAFIEGYNRILLIPFIDRIPNVAWIIAAAALTLAIGALAAMLWRLRRYAEWPRTPIMVFGGFVLIYPASIILAAYSGMTWDGFEVRYFVPMWLPLLILTAMFLDTTFGMIRGGRLSGALRAGAAKATTAVISLILCVSVATMLMADVMDTANVNKSGLSHISALSELDVIQYVQNNHADDLIHSNAPFTLYFYTNGKAKCRLIPRSRHAGYVILNENEGISRKEQLRRYVTGVGEGEYLVWLNEWYSNYLYDFGPAEMRASPRLELIADLNDGLIFQVIKPAANQ